MDKKFYITFEAARLLKEKGYDKECIAYYQNDEFRPYSLTRSGLSMYNKNAAPDYMNQYSAPTKAEAIDWLESRGMRINIIYDWLECRWYFTIINGSPTVKSITELEVSDSVFYKTRLEAEDAAIIKALELL